MSKDLAHYVGERQRGLRMVREAEQTLREAEQSRRLAEERERSAKAALVSARSWLATQEEMIVIIATRQHSGTVLP